MLNILGEGSGAQGEQASEQLMARAMQVYISAFARPPAEFTCNGLLHHQWNHLVLIVLVLTTMALHSLHSLQKTCIMPGMRRLQQAWQFTVQPQVMGQVRQVPRHSSQALLQTVLSHLVYRLSFDFLC